MVAALVGEVGPAAADAVALGECAVEQDVIGIRLPQDPQQTGRPPGQVVDNGGDAGMGSADGYAETGGDLRQRVMPAKVDQADESTLVARPTPWTTSSLAGDARSVIPASSTTRIFGSRAVASVLFDR